MEFKDLRTNVIDRILVDDRVYPSVLVLETDGGMWHLYHEQDCCEQVRLVDIVGDVHDILNEVVISAEVRTSDAGNAVNDSGTWTFYNIATMHGDVTLRWLGESNGYYSEAVEVSHYATQQPWVQNLIDITSIDSN